MSGIAFRGASLEQDARFGDKSKKLQQTLSFPAIYARPVDLKKVAVPLLRPWVAARVTELLGLEDEVIVSLIFNLLEQPCAASAAASSSVKATGPDAKDIQVNLTGFMGAAAARELTEELWAMLLSAAESKGGVAPKLIEWQKNKAGGANTTANVTAGANASIASGGVGSGSGAAASASSAGASSASDAVAEALARLKAINESIALNKGNTIANSSASNAGNARDRSDRDGGYSSSNSNSSNCANAGSASAGAGADGNTMRRKKRWDN